MTDTRQYTQSPDLIKTIVGLLKASTNGGFKCGRNEIEMIKTNDLLHFNVLTMYELGQRDPVFFFDVYTKDSETPIGSIAPVVNEETREIDSWLLVRRFGDNRYMDSVDGLFEDMATKIAHFFYLPNWVFVETYRQAALDKIECSRPTEGVTGRRTHGGHDVETTTKEWMKNLMEEELLGGDQVIGAQYGYFELTDSASLKGVILHVFGVGRGEATYTQALLLEGSGRFRRILGSFTLEDGYVNMKSGLYTGERPFDSADQLFDIVSKYLVEPSRAHHTHI